MNFTIEDVDASAAATFRDYTLAKGPEHDESYAVDEEIERFDPAREPAVLAFADDGTVMGAASVMVEGYSTEGTARFRVFHALDARVYPIMLARLLPRLPADVRRVFLFLPREAGTVEDTLAAAGFAITRRATLLLHDDPRGVEAAPLPAGVTLQRVEGTHAEMWAGVVNAVFHGEPGHYDMTVQRAGELLSRERVLRGASFVAMRDGRSAGIVLTVHDQDDASLAEVETLGVMVADQGRGLGKALLTSALAGAAEVGIERVTLSTGETNERALGLYIGVGFRVVDARVCWERDLTQHPATS